MDEEEINVEKEEMELMKMMSERWKMEELKVDEIERRERVSLRKM